MDDGNKAPDAATSVPSRPHRRTAKEVLRSLGQPKVAVMLLLGFGSGLPFMLIGNTLGLWLATFGVKVSTIGFLAWAGLAFSWQFLWAIPVDRVRLPLFSRLGRRRGWILFCQIAVALGLVGMAASNPTTGLRMLTGFAIFTALAAATQDTAINAWRIETAKDADELGLLTSAYSLGYRAALIGTEGVILLVANAIGWPLAYAIYGASMIIAVIALLFAKEPARADAVMAAIDSGERRDPVRVAYETVIEPFIAFFRANGGGMAVLILGMITLYHLCDYMRGPMSNPYYIALHIPITTIGYVRLSIGLVGSLIGIAVGGLASLRLGHWATLILGSILQPIGIAAFALLGWHGGDFSLLAMGPVHITAFEAIMAFDAFAIAFSGVALVSYMSSLTTLGYTAIQYALLSSAVNMTGKSLKGFSGVIVQALQRGRTPLEGYALFYVLAGAIGLPAIALCIVLAMWKPGARPSPLPEAVAD